MGRTWLICNQDAGPMSRVAISSSLSCLSVLFTEPHRLAALHAVLQRCRHNDHAASDLRDKAGSTCIDAASLSKLHRLSVGQI